MTLLDAAGNCIYSGKDPGEYMDQYHKGEHWGIMPLGQALELRRKHNRSKYIKPPVRITEERWDEQLNVLPPAKWTSRKFFVSECITDDLYTCCARINYQGEWQYFEMVESIYASDAEITKRVLSVIK